MRLFGISEAEHYCSSFQNLPGLAEGSLRDYQRNKIRFRNHTIVEGSTIFDEFRSCSLREVDRCLFLAASHYRRFLDLMIPSATHWASVTLYYGCWYASRALLGMFGCIIFDNMVIDVQNSTPGNQELRVRIINRGQNQLSTYRGSHERYWDLFYQAVRQMIHMVPTNLSIALSPIDGNPKWHIAHRNKVNYDTFKGLELARDFQSGFNHISFPNSLPGILATQYAINEALLELAVIYAKQFRLTTDALNFLSSSSALKQQVKSMIYHQKPPALVKKTRKNIIFS